jgi:hypothetical protein
MFVVVADEADLDFARQVREDDGGDGQAGPGEEIHLIHWGSQWTKFGL